MRHGTPIGRSTRTSSGLTIPISSTAKVAEPSRVVSSTCSPTEMSLRARKNPSRCPAIANFPYAAQPKGRSCFIHSRRPETELGLIFAHRLDRSRRGRYGHLGGLIEPPESLPRSDRPVNERSHVDRQQNCPATSNTRSTTGRNGLRIINVLRRSATKSLPHRARMPTP